LAFRTTQDFLRTEAGGGFALIAAAALALLLANSPWSGDYFALLQRDFTISIGGFSETLSRGAWVRDGLMAVFFFVVGLEVKQEALKGELSSARKLALPAIAALGGVVGPALVYLAVNAGVEGAPEGWPVTTPTDMAVAMAALALVGRDLPESLRLFMLALALVSNLGTVALTTALYSDHIHYAALVGAGATLAVLILLSRWKEAPFLFRMAGFLTLGAFVLKSGVSTSVAGVAAALTVPIGVRGRTPEPVLKHFMDSLHPYVAYGIVPLFAFSAAGVSLGGLSAGGLLRPAPLGIVAALILGKPAGMIGASWLAIRSGLARRPTGATWGELFGVALVCGAGAAMSLYLAAPAFVGLENPAKAASVAAIGVGSLVAALAGSAVLGLSAVRRRRLRGEAGD